MNPDLELQPVSIVSSSTALTGSYVALGSNNPFSGTRANTLCLNVGYLQGNETSLQIKVEASLDGTNYGQQTTSSPSGAEITETIAEHTLTGAGSATQNNFMLVIAPIRGKSIRISAKATGGTPTGTITFLQAAMTWA